MQNRNDDLLKEAEDLENQSKIEIINKNYDSAISLLLKAKDIYSQVGLTGQVGILIREIIRLRNLNAEEKKLIKPAKIFVEDVKIEDDKEFENKGNIFLEEARELALDGDLNEAIKVYNDAYNIFKKVNSEFECKQILWQINEIREYQKWEDSHKSKGIKVAVKDIVALSTAEKRRLKIQKELETKKKVEKLTKKPKIVEEEKIQPKLFQELTEKAKIEEERKRVEKIILQEQQELRKEKIIERGEKLRQIREKKKREESLLKEAEENLDKAKQSIKKNLFDEAKLYYENAIGLFNELGWYNQVKTLQRELFNINVYKKEAEQKLQHEIMLKQRSHEEFQKRVTSTLSEQKIYQEKQLKRLSALPPEIKNKLEKAKLIKEKAEKEEELKRYSRVIGRYEYLLELYESIPSDFVDLSEEISEVEKKISELKEKL
ncbi:MAG: hypothetical protein ACFE85_16460 [Candidatus Hodarchaeota archaeon]